jgi:hypothetical protein
MAIVINGSGTVTGISVGGLPDGIVDSGTLATNSVDSAELIDGAVDDSHMAAMAASKLTGALPAISGASLTGLTSSQLPAGSVIQVVSELNNTALVWTDGSQQTAVTDSITVQEGNKVLMNFVGALSNESIGTGSWNSMAFLYLYQDSSSIRELEHDAMHYVNDSNHRVYNVAGSHLTGTLSAGTYAFSLQVDPHQANSFSVNRSGSHPSSMILMEIQV